MAGPTKKKFHRYMIRTKHGTLQPWTGPMTEKEADEWYKNHGKWWEERGKKLVRVSPHSEVATRGRYA